MLAKSKFLLLFVLFSLIFAMSGSTKAQGGTVVDVIRRDGRLGQFYQAIQAAGLEGMLNGPGPYTIFAPVNGSYGSAGDVNAARQSVLYHTVGSRVGYGTLKGSTTLATVLGPNIHVSNNRSVTLNDRAKLVAIDIPAGNGTIHLINAKLEPLEPVAAAPAPAAAQAAGAAAPTPEVEDINTLIAADFSHIRIHSATQNPAFISGNKLPYHSGVHSDSSFCKGLTWVMQYQANGVTQVGSDRKSNPYRGDTGCGSLLPILCLNRTFTPAPSSQYQDGWAFGEVKVTTPIQGTQLTSRQQADNFCVQAYGDGWRQAEFHDGNMGASTGHVSGHDFWARGSLPSGQRFWVAIDNQPANPWNSVVAKSGPPNIVYGPNLFNVGSDPAFQGNSVLRMSQAQGLSAGRYGCQGTTMVLHQQINGKVQVGLDQSSNPFVGDRPCSYRLPILCIKVDGYAPPANSHGRNFSHGWSAGHLKPSRPVTGNEISTVGAASQVCEQTFGTGWRMATFHDGSMGTSNTDGWEMWGYGSFPLGLRMWAAVNDQPANPWNK